MADKEMTKRERKALKKQEQETHRLQKEEEHRKATRNTWTIVIIAAVVIIGFLAWIIQNRPQQAHVSDSTPTQINPVSAADHVEGASAQAAKATLVEYGDYQCPACGAYYPVVKQVVASHADSLRFVFRNLPIPQLHPNAELAARFAEAAGDQGKYFEMHDKLYENQKTWAPLSTGDAQNTFVQYGKDLGLDTTKLVTDANSATTTQVIESERIDAIGAGAQGTPTFFLDGKLIQNPQSLDAFNALIDNAVGSTSPIGSSSAPTLPSPTAVPQ